MLPRLGLLVHEEAVEDALIELGGKVRGVLWYVEAHSWLIDEFGYVDGYYAVSESGKNWRELCIGC